MCMHQMAQDAVAIFFTGTYSSRAPSVQTAWVLLLCPAVCQGKGREDLESLEQQECRVLQKVFVWASQ